MPVALTITLTGLVYSLVWGSAYTSASGAAPAVPKSLSPPGASLLSLDRAVAITRTQYPEATFVDVRLPAKPDEAIVARAKLNETSGPRTQIVLALDRSTGEVLDRQSSEQYQTLRWWRTTWNYPLHVGSVLGTPTKVLWLMTCGAGGSTGNRPADVVEAAPLGAHRFPAPARPCGSRVVACHDRVVGSVPTARRGEHCPDTDR